MIVNVSVVRFAIAPAPVALAEKSNQYAVFRVSPVISWLSEKGALVALVSALKVLDSPAAVPVEAASLAGAVPVP